MPAKVGVLKVVTLSSSSILNIGDVYHMAPRAVVKTFAGGGSFNTGNGIRVNIHQSSTNVMDNEIVDQPVSGNA